MLPAAKFKNIYKNKKQAYLSPSIYLRVLLLAKKNPIKKGAKAFFIELSAKYIIKIFTTINRLLTSKWLIHNDIDYLIKEPCWVYIDDRCINFDYNFDNVLNKINDFKPYYKIYSI